MALWDLYLETKSWWARQTGWSVYGMIRDAVWLIDDWRLKKLPFRDEGKLARQHFATVPTPRDIFNGSGILL
jgi:hypothetical protein